MLQAKVLSTPQGDKAFWDWAVEIQSNNVLLQGTTSYLNEDALWNQIEANRWLKLSEACRNELIDEIQDFHLWLETMQGMDERRQREMALQW